MIHRHIVPALIAKTKAIALLFLATVPLAVTAALSTLPVPRSNDPAPEPGLEPAEVVRIQVEALRDNNHMDEGIELTYRFASPGNKRNTGPLVRFVDMVHSKPYNSLLNHQSARFGPVAVSSDKAYQKVIITDKEGKQITYHWILSRQRVGEFKDCWMTNAVIPARQPAMREA